ncbi:hypothetical protein D9619_004687 [Psilocybe cf. subviscida]|uniref:BTB domain-containing protein n=1 Tax=Psilocybe cf. subviscida TaxID=2480587 RepID=A0A8H5F7N7_9AGAR|nr:hypothetical protein D9619_004687 [Psilocybe cf. subviscida]
MIIMNYEDYVMEEIWGSAISLPPSNLEKLKSSGPYTASTNVFSVSKTFHTKMLPAPDTSLLSSDGVYFCVHLKTIHRHCPEAFQAFFDALSHQTGSNPTRPVMLDCTSEELNIILHTLYDMSLGAYRPSPEIVAASLDRMPSLGISVQQVIYPECAMYRHIVSYAPLQAIDVYTMAAHHGIHALAVHASSYLLHLDMQAIPEDVCVRMGPLYLLKLIRLHAKRFEALKAELFVFLPVHPPAKVDACSFRQQQYTKHIWALFCAEPMWHTRPIDLAIQAMEETLYPMMEDLACNDCKSTLRKMVARVRSQWTLAPLRAASECIMYPPDTAVGDGPRALREKGARMCGITLSILVTQGVVRGVRWLTPRAPSKWLGVCGVLATGHRALPTFSPGSSSRKPPFMARVCNPPHSALYNPR